METNKTVKAEMGEVIDTHISFLTRSFLTIIMLTCLSILSGCQDQMTTIKTQDFNYPVLANETNPEPVPSQLASKVTLKSISDEEMPIVNSQNRESHIPKDILAYRYNNISIHDLNMNKQSWKEAYDGKGIPIMKISF